ncbi:MAG: MFS transporter [bacterium]|nr:MFS transporter [bacterium]
MKNDKRTIFGWAMYDWANSAYITVFGAVIGAFFTGTIMPDDTYWGLSGEALWSLLIGAGSILLMLAMPVLGAIADYASAKRMYLRNFAFLGAVFVLITPFVPDGQVPLFLVVAVVGQFGFVAANVFYDGFLPEISTDDTIDKVSSKGFALGYLGGGIYLLLALVLIFLSSDEAGATLTESLAARISIFGSGIWWIGFSLFALARFPKDGAPPDDLRSFGEYVRIGFGRTQSTVRKLRTFPQLLLFVIAFIIYNSGTGTVIAVSGPYAEDTLELELATIALAFLLVQFIAFFGALMFGKMSDRVGPKRAIMTTLFIWVGIAVMAFFIPKGSDAGFLLLAAIVGFVLGGVQALSRSLYGTMIPEEASAEFFGFFSVFSKLSGIGPLVFGLISAATGSGRAAILSVAAFFIVGLFLLAKVDIDEARRSRERWSFDGASAEAD